MDAPGAGRHDAWRAEWALEFAAVDAASVSTDIASGCLEPHGPCRL